MKELKVLMYVNQTEEYIEILGNRIYGYDSFEKFQEQLKIYDSLQQRVDKAVEEIENFKDYMLDEEKINRTMIALKITNIQGILKGDK